jgi:hypothetical protein
VEELNSDEELEADIARMEAAIDNCFRRRAKRAGIAVRELGDKHMKKRGTSSVKSLEMGLVHGPRERRK